MTRVPRSMALYERALELIPVGTQLISRRPNRVAYGVSPIYAVKASGARFLDVDGNEYIDWISGIGAILLGYADPVVDDAVKEQIAHGTMYSVNHELEIELAICFLFCHPKCNTFPILSNSPRNKCSFILIACSFKWCIASIAEAFLLFTFFT